MLLKPCVGKADGTHTYLHPSWCWKPLSLGQELKLSAEWAHYSCLLCITLYVVLSISKHDSMAPAYLVAHLSPINQPVDVDNSARPQGNWNHRLMGIHGRVGTSWAYVLKEMSLLSLVNLLKIKKCIFDILKWSLCCYLHAFPKRALGPGSTLFKQRHCAWVILGALDSEFLINLLHLWECCVRQRGQYTFIFREWPGSQPQRLPVILHF